MRLTRRIGRYDAFLRQTAMRIRADMLARQLRMSSRSPAATVHLAFKSALVCCTPRLPSVPPEGIHPAYAKEIQR